MAVYRTLMHKLVTTSDYFRQGNSTLEPRTLGKRVSYAFSIAMTLRGPVAEPPFPEFQYFFRGGGG
jgi:hypothetical protein